LKCLTVTLLSHQIGGFFGVWLAALAALCNLPIREENVSVRLAPA